AEIFAEEIGQHTTSAVAAAIWFPYDAEPADAVIRWSLEAFEVLRGLSRNPSSGVSMIELRCFSRLGELPIPDWAHPLGARPIENGFALDVPLTDTTLYLNYLANRFRKSGGKISSSVHFNHIDEINADYSLVVNCSGAGAQTLVPDPDVEPHRGQVVLVEKLSQHHAVVCDDPPLMYAIPRANDCVFGGSNDISANRDPDPGLTSSIVAECSRVLHIAPPKILSERVGLRPFRRSGICLRRDGRVIHNYGHGGSGFTLSWGCARAVLALAS
ncbi:MAG: FAD-binding oxidoreductase, partial [Verrucomicrobiota bacterium]|nr:FAD-binding oxidoreductase [Verrucomicrobiota bacterium]